MIYKRPQQGFTLIEMIVVITITGILGAMVAIFLRAPLQQYTATARRAEMTDIADTALRRIGRDLRLALPNSVRVTGTCGGSGECLIEFLPTKGGGRYRADTAQSGTNVGCGSLVADVLDFTAADSCFEVLGSAMAVNQYTANTDRIVIYNLGTSVANAYALNNTGVYASNTASTITLNPGKQFPLESPSSRFQVISTPVTYACDGAGVLWRYWNYAIQFGQPASIAALKGLAGALSAKMADNVSTCNFSYDVNVVARRAGLVTMNLGITEDNESVTLYSATHVSNVP